MNAQQASCGWSFTYLILTTVAFYHLHLKPRSPIPPSFHLSKVYTLGGKNCLQLCKAHSRSHAVFVHFFDYFIFSCLPPLVAALLFWAKEKRWHPDCCRASVVSSFLTFLWWEGSRVKSRDHVETAASPALSLFFYVHLLLSLLSVLPCADLHSSCCFPSTSPFFLPAFLITPLLFFPIHPHTQRWYQPFWWETTSDRDPIVILLCVFTAYGLEGHCPLAVTENDFSLLFSFCSARHVKVDQQRALLVLSSVTNKRFFNRFFFFFGGADKRQRETLVVILFASTFSHVNNCNRLPKKNDRNWCI